MLKENLLITLCRLDHFHLLEDELLGATIITMVNLILSSRVKESVQESVFLVEDKEAHRVEGSRCDERFTAAFHKICK